MPLRQLLESLNHFVCSGFLTSGLLVFEEMGDIAYRTLDINVFAKQ